MKRVIEKLLILKKEYERVYQHTKGITSTEPKGTLRSSYRHGKNSFYVREANGDKTPPGGRYLSRKNLQLAREIANYDYALAINKELEHQIKAIDKAIKNISRNKFIKIYDKLSPGRKELVTPFFKSDKEYAEEWQAKEYAHKEFKDGMFELYSERGERVRSKSEKIIADKLYMMGVPYIYEAPLSLKGLGTIHPDFTILDVANRREIFWEHLGMMDNPEYAERAIERINQYAKNNILQGDQLIITYETSRQPLDSKCLDKIISVFTR